MAKVIVTGHGGYATGVFKNLKMLLGEPEGFFFVDFNPDDNLEILDEKLKNALLKCGEDEALLACDLAGGSPFRQAAMLCLEHPNYVAVAGLNAAAYAEMVYNLSLPVGELAALAIDTTKNSIMRFPNDDG